MSSELDDAKHSLEQRSLRNVRALVDRLEEDERTRYRRPFFAAIVLALAILVVLFSLLAARGFFMPSLSEEQLRVKEERRKAGMAAFEKSTAASYSNRRKYEVTATSAPAFQAYANGCMTRIVELGNTEYRSALVGVAGTALVKITIRFDGLIQGAEVVKWTGNAMVEPAASRVVRLVGSCDQFPVEVRKEAEIVYIIEPLEFGPKGISQ
jgi:hypothetical protein